MRSRVPTIRSNPTPSSLSSIRSGRSRAAWPSARGRRSQRARRCADAVTTRGGPQVQPRVRRAVTFQSSSGSQRIASATTTCPDVRSDSATSTGPPDRSNTPTSFHPGTASPPSKVTGCFRPPLDSSRWRLPRASRSKGDRSRQRPSDTATPGRWIASRQRADVGTSAEKTARVEPLPAGVRASVRR